MDTYYKIIGWQGLYVKKEDMDDITAMLEQAGWEANPAPHNERLSIIQPDYHKPIAPGDEGIQVLKDIARYVHGGLIILEYGDQWLVLSYVGGGSPPLESGAIPGEWPELMRKN